MDEQIVRQGRPPLPEEEVRKNTTFMLEPEKLRQLNQLARKRGTTRSKLIRQLVLDVLEQERRQAQKGGR